MPWVNYLHPLHLPLAQTFLELGSLSRPLLPKMGLTESAQFLYTLVKADAQTSVFFSTAASQVWIREEGRREGAGKRREEEGSGVGGGSMCLLGGTH